MLNYASDLQNKANADKQAEAAEEAALLSAQAAAVHHYGQFLRLRPSGGDLAHAAAAAASGSMLRHGSDASSAIGVGTGATSSSTRALAPAGAATSPDSAQFATDATVAFRLVGMLVEASEQNDRRALQLLGASLAAVPADRFLPALPQIVVHLSSPSDVMCRAPSSYRLASSPTSAASQTGAGAGRQVAPAAMPLLAALLRGHGPGVARADGAAAAAAAAGSNSSVSMPQLLASWIAWSTGAQLPGMSAAAAMGVPAGSLGPASSPTSAAAGRPSALSSSPSELGAPFPGGSAFSQRLGTATSLAPPVWSFAAIIQYLSLRMAIAHPYRTVLQLLPLERAATTPVSSTAATTEGGAASASAAGASPTPAVRTSAARAAGARHVMECLATLSPHLRHVVAALGLLSDALVSVARFNPASLLPKGLSADRLMDSARRQIFPLRTVLLHRWSAAAGKLVAASRAAAGARAAGSSGAAGGTSGRGSGFAQLAEVDPSAAALAAVRALWPAEQRGGSSGQPGPRTPEDSIAALFHPACAYLLALMPVLTAGHVDALPACTLEDHLLNGTSAAASYGGWTYQPSARSAAAKSSSSSRSSGGAGAFSLGLSALGLSGAGAAASVVGAGRSGAKAQSLWGVLPVHMTGMGDRLPMPSSVTLSSMLAAAAAAASTPGGSAGSVAGSVGAGDGASGGSAATTRAAVASASLAQDHAAAAAAAASMQAEATAGGLAAKDAATTTAAVASLLQQPLGSFEAALSRMLSAAAAESRLGCYTVASAGNTMPKVLRLHGSDGRSHRCLAKWGETSGADDLRQDAVMEQVFAAVNALLLADPAARARRLRVRTYRIVVLTATVGVLEWVDRAISFGGYLMADPHAAHQRYHPDEISPMDARLQVAAARAQYDAVLKDVQKHAATAAVAALRAQAAASGAGPPDEAGEQAAGAAAAAAAKVPTAEDPRLRGMGVVMERLTPVFRHFFPEFFPSPALWREARDRHARSAAAASIVGYALGIGDRHVNNILVDTCTGEVVHIDFGVAFEQGEWRDSESRARWCNSAPEWCNSAPRADSFKYHFFCVARYYFSGFLPLSSCLCRLQASCCRRPSKSHSA